MKSLFAPALSLLILAMLGLAVFLTNANAEGFASGYLGPWVAQNGERITITHKGSTYTAKECGTLSGMETSVQFALIKLPDGRLALPAQPTPLPLNLTHSPDRLVAGPMTFHRLSGPGQC